MIPISPGEPAPETEPSALRELYEGLYANYGPQHWWPGEGPFEVIVGAILTQAAAWTNVELALSNLKAAGCWSLEEIGRRSQEEMAALVRPSGYFNAKARKLKAFADHVNRFYAGDLAAPASWGQTEPS